MTDFIQEWIHNSVHVEKYRNIMLKIFVLFTVLTFVLLIFTAIILMNLE